MQSLAKECSTASRGGVVPRARKRVGPVEFGEKPKPTFEQQFDPFGESIYDPADFWEASFYHEPSDTPMEVYVDSKSAATTCCVFPVAFHSRG